MNRNQYEVARRARVVAEIGRSRPELTEEERLELVEEAIEEELRMEAEDRAEYAETSEDSPCIQSANLWGTGEGRYHGIIG